MTLPAVLAVDGGGSKIDAALVGRGGALVAAAPIQNHDPSHNEVYLEAIGRAVETVARRAGLDPQARPLADVGVYCLAGADFLTDERRLLAWLSKMGWTVEQVLRNDTFAVLRTGSDRTWGVGVVCGAGTNCAGVSPEGRQFRLPAIGHISGDWGGAGDLGGDALWYAVRAEDGRGPRTALTRLVPEHFGLKRARQVTEAIHRNRLGAARPFAPGEGDGHPFPSGAEVRLHELAPVVFRAAAEGDAIARGLVDRQADEIVTMAGTAIRKLRMRDLDVDVALGGGIFRNRFAPFLERIERGLREVAPRARVSVVTAPPVVGAALIGLDAAGATRAAARRLRSALTDGRMSADTRTRG
jgi:N-acetylglucosamine kinase-like BadF-type ATPase